MHVRMGRFHMLYINIILKFRIYIHDLAVARFLIPDLKVGTLDSLMVQYSYSSFRIQLFCCLFNLYNPLRYPLL